MNIFRKPYIIRRFGEQSIEHGYRANDFSDFSTMLDIQPLKPNELEALREGHDIIKAVKAWSAISLVEYSERDQTWGDWLYFNGEWYECVSCVEWSHTPLMHYKSEFVVTPNFLSRLETLGPEDLPI